jgi:hypothetical protein
MVRSDADQEGRDEREIERLDRRSADLKIFDSGKAPVKPCNATAIFDPDGVLFAFHGF